MLRASKILYLLLVGIILSSYQLPPGASTFYVEHARTKKRITWGLMQRRHLPENHGMLFHFSRSQVLNFWSFNCFIDFSVAFIDEHKVVRAIRTLKAFPVIMDPARPVLSYHDLKLYPKSDPIIVFFRKRSVSSSVPVKYILEMNLGWFERNHVQIGDVLYWDDSNNALFVTPISSKPIPKYSGF